MLKLLMFLIPIILFQPTYAQWNSWNDAESVRILIIKAQNSGKSYFSQFHEYDVRSKNIYTSQYREHTGEIPYIYGLDFYYASGTYFPDNVKLNIRENVIKIVRNKWREKKAIPSFSWHLENPYVHSDFGNYMGCRYRYRVNNNTYPKKHRYIISEILTNKGGEPCGYGTYKAQKDHEALYLNPQEWFDARCREVADIINELVDDNGIPIPFIFRLWHECEDSWMWWGKTSVSVEDYKNFFIYTQNKIKKYAPNAQILWGYCPGREWKNKEDFMIRYPGDAYVDIIGYDDYEIGNPDIIEITTEKAKIVSSCAKDHGKIAALFETANSNKNTSNDFFIKYLLPLIQKSGVDLGIIQIWISGLFDNNLQYKDRTEFLKSSRIIIADSIN